MPRFRVFKNSDPPKLVHLWRKQAPSRGLLQPITTSVLTETVLAKPYFENCGLIVAESGNAFEVESEILGFVHAGFGPTQGGDDIDFARGCTCMLMTVANDPDLEDQLLNQSEQFLTSRGAKELFGGAVDPMGPFYLGLYGGSRTRGILKSDEDRSTLYRRNGYHDHEEYIVLQRELSGFRPLVDRTQMKVRRSHNVELFHDPKSPNWWSACNVGQTDHSRFNVVARDTGQSVGSVVFWEMQPISHSWGVHTVGLLDLMVEQAERRKGLGTFLVGEAMRQLAASGAHLVEVHVRNDNQPGLKLLEKLGFREVDRGVVFKKS